VSRACVTILAAALAALAAPAAWAQPVNPIHPVFAPLDALGHKVARAEEVSPDATCGACHDATYIAAHSGHASPSSQATCVQCHLSSGELEVRADRLDAEGRLPREAIRIGTPRAANCAACHGLIVGAEGAVVFPSELEGPPTPGGRSFSLTLGEGAVVSPQRMADAFVDLAGKAELTAPWDIHAAKLVDCVACHYAANNPARVDAKHTTLRYLISDPRRQSTAEFLVRPDHRLSEETCRSCHEPMKAHEFLPYRSRHMTVLSCQACHLAAPAGPAVELYDATVVTAAGGPAVRWRNVERRPGDTLSSATVRRFQPLLAERVETDGVRRIVPVNPVSTYRWVSGPDRAEVPWAQVTLAFKDGSAYAPPVLERFDANRDGQLDAQELRIDSPAKRLLVVDRLRGLGVLDPVIEGTLRAYPLAHGVPSREQALKDCEACHSKASRLSGDYLVAGYLPGGEPPRPDERSRVELSGLLAPGTDGSLWLQRAPGAPRGALYVLGSTRQELTNTLGFATFLLVFLGVLAHGLTRWLTRARRAAHPHSAPLVRTYAFGRYERLWHWTMALSGALLIATGLEIHRGDSWLLDLPRAISLHNVFAMVLMVNASLSLFHHVVTRAIRNFIPDSAGLLKRVVANLTYQSRGIFFGVPEPSNAPGQKLNPVQQLTYLALLNVLFPLQIVTGLLIWAAGRWPEVAAALGGLSFVAPLHNAGSWLFLSFFVLHVYLVTTGRTPSEHLESMITGYRHVEVDAAEPQRSQT
jgi:thiosulfate reductase cytochrome b subunit